MALTIFGGSGFVGSEYVRQFHHHAIGNVSSVNKRDDLEVYSEDTLYLISTVHNYHIFTDAFLDIETNLTLLIRVLENWKTYQQKHGVKGTFNFISSWSVYGNQKELPVREDAICDPKGFYIITKRCAEQMLISYCETFGLKYRILRMGNVIGPGDKPSTQKNVLQHSVNQLAAGKDVELFGDGNFYRDFIHVRDAARAIETVISKGAVNEIFNIGNGDPGCWSYNVIMDYLKNRLHTYGKIVYKEPTEFQKKVPVHSFYMDVTKLRSLGFVPEHINAGLFDTLLR